MDGALEGSARTDIDDVHWLVDEVEFEIRSSGETNANRSTSSMTRAIFASSSAMSSDGGPAQGRPDRDWGERRPDRGSPEKNATAADLVRKGRN